VQGTNVTVLLNGSCRCGAVRFSVRSQTPVPYQRCYCSICRKTAGGGGCAINIGAQTHNLTIEDTDGSIGIFYAHIRQDDRHCKLSSAQRKYCKQCAAALWLFSPEWPELIHPFASVIDSELPTPRSTVHMMLRFKPNWVVPQFGEGDARFDLYPEQSLEDWHRSHGLWAE
jgi:hypothetical protein